MAVLITGGLNYIGSHIAKELLSKEEEVILYGSSSNLDVAKRLKELTNRTIKVYIKDLNDTESLTKIFTENKIESVIHAEELSVVEDSVNNPIEYYKLNVSGTINLIETMDKFNCKRLIALSSYQVYGKSGKILETDRLAETFANPYASTKISVERLYEDLYNSDKDWSIMVLRVFSPIGADDSRLIGEDYNSVSLTAEINKSILENKRPVKVYGNNYGTFDKTYARDYVNITDISDAFVKSLKKVRESKEYNAVNIGSGKPTTCANLIKLYEFVGNKKLDTIYERRMKEELETVSADCTKAKEVIFWNPTKLLDYSIKTSIEFASNDKNRKTVIEKELKKKKNKEVVEEVIIEDSKEE